MCESDCKGKKDCACAIKKEKSPFKTFDSPASKTPIYTNGHGTSLALTVIADHVHKKCSFVFGSYHLFENDEGELLIRTGLKRDKSYDKRTCVQPCSGECESCPAG